MRKINKLITMFLTIVMISSSLPTMAFAERMYKEDITSTVEQQQTKSTDVKVKKKEPKILKEIVEKRESNIKHFLLDNFSYEAVVYNQPVHYLENGQWQDIDNSLVDPASNEDVNSNINQDPENKFGSGTEEEGTKYVLENKANDFKVKIAKNTKSSKLVSVKKGEYEISWDLPDANNVKARQVPIDTKAIDSSIEKAVDDELSKDKEIEGFSPEEKAEIKKIKIENEREKRLTDTGSKVEFIDIFPEVDLQYETIGSMVKENIVLNEKISNPVFKFNLNVKNLKARLDKDNVITFYDIKDESKIFKINAPYMFDAKYQDSNKIKIELNNTINGYELILNPDKEWLDSTEREYPITIDPQVTTSLDINDIQDNFICTGDTEYKWQNQFLRVGYNSSIGICRSYLRFTLPKLSSGDMVISATFGLASDQVPTGAQINVHKVNFDWINQYLCWNSNPGYDSKIQDYQMMYGQNVAWDITTIAKEWYNTGKNYGLMLKSQDESVTNSVFGSSDNSNAGIRPRAAIVYVNYSGLENYWGYHSASAGKAGTGYTNDYNGNLVFIHDDLSMNGNKMPVNIKHVFNSNNREKTRPDGDNSMYAYYGPGWRLNISQRVIPTGIGETPYLYIDEDGTSHYFKYDATNDKYVDESGVDLTLKTSYIGDGIDSGYCITDKKDNKLIFTSTGFLYRIKDSNNNKLTLNYNGAVLCQVTDGAERYTYIESDANGVLLSIVDPSKRKTKFSYNGAVLEQITYPDGKYTKYTYDSNNNLQTVQNFDGVKLTYNYYTSSPFRVSSVSQSHTNGTQGGTLSMVYGYNQTTFTDVENKKFVYQFNNSGNTVSVKDNDGNAQYYKFIDDGNIKNKMSLESKLQKVTNNILNNHNVENSSYSTWSVDSSPGGLGSSTFSATEKYMGNQSMQIMNLNSASNFRFRQDVNLERGKTYTLSGYVKTVGVDTTGLDTKGANLFVLFYNNAGAPEIRRSQYVAGTNDWQRIEMSFTIPSQATSTSIQIYAGLNNSQGTAYFDCLQLEEGLAASRYNLVENANFNYGSGAMPLYWNKSGTCDQNDNWTSTEGKTAFKFNGYGNINKNIGQEINVSGKKGDNFILSGWAKGDSVPMTLNASRYFAIEVGIFKTDGTSQWAVAKFNEDNSEWQFVSEPIIADGDYSKVVVYGLYNLNANTAYFDSINLYKEEFGTSYQYDAKGNITSTANASKQNSSFQYNGNDLIKNVDAKGNQFSYEYDNNDTTLKKHNLTKATTAENVVYSFEYDSSGNAKKAIVGDVNSLFLTSSAEYTTSGNYLKSITDSSGNTVTNNWDETKGTLKSVVDGNEKSTFYTYDSMDRLQTVNKNVENNALEIFSLDNNTLGSNGTTTVDEIVKYESDANGTYFGSYDGTYISNPSKIVYDLGINSSSGTMALKFKYGTSGDKQIFENASANGKLNLYTNSQDNLILGLANNSGTWIQLIKISDVPVLKNQWNFVVLRWEYIAGGLKCTLFLNDKSYSNTTSDFKEFSGGKTGVGNSTTGIYQINGLIDNFAYSPRALSDTEITSLKQGTLQPVTGGNTYNYQNDRLQKIIHNGVIYSFGYDSLGNNTTVNVGKQNLITNNYDTRTGKLLSSTYGNGQTVSNDYDSLNRIKKKTIDRQDRFTYDYDASGNLALYKDLVNKKGIKYNYDTSNRLVSILQTELDDSNSIKYSTTSSSLTSYGYDLNNNLSLLMERVGLNSYTTNYSYDKDNRPIGIVYNNGVQKIANLENFSLSDTLIGSRGTKPYMENAFFVEDSNKKVLASASQVNNLVLNPSFESSTTSWNRGDWKGTTGMTKISSDNADGGSSLEFYDSDGKTDGSNTATVAYQYIEFTSSLIEDKDYAFSTYAKRIGGTQPKLSIQCLNSSGGIVNGANWVEEKSIPENQWTYINHKFTVPKDTKKVLIAIRADVKDKNVVRFDGVQFEPRNYAAPYKYSGTKILYNLGLNKDAGTMSTWFKTNTSGTDRYIINTESTTKMFNLYVGSNDKLGLMIGSGTTNTWLKFISTDQTVDVNKWHFTAIKWKIENSQLQCSIYFDGNLVKTETIASGFKDFANGNTAIGSNINGNYQLEGMLDQFNYSSNAMSDTEIRDLYQSGRGNLINYSYDTIGRLKTKTINISTAPLNPIKTTYTFVQAKNISTTGNAIATTNQIESIINNVNNNDSVINYTYDKKGNIETITQDSKTITYHYDDLNQLIREDNKVLDKTIVYSYDGGGNIQSNTEYPYNLTISTDQLKEETRKITFKYENTNWKDELTGYIIDEDGVGPSSPLTKSIKYSSSGDIGNPINDGKFIYTWKVGRQLETVSGNGVNASYTYNDSGIRTKKVVNNVTTDYHLVGDKVTYEQNATDKIYYTYDSANDLVSMNLNGVEYYYVRNAQNDIIGLIDGTGNQVVSYMYDSWGKLINIKDGNGNDVSNDTTNIGYKNPYRYRGYRYDNETQLYYLNSRYYNAEWGRFINADGIIGKTGELLSHNLFTYCLNNPVNMEDDDGFLPRWAKVAIGVGVIAGLGILTVATAGTGTALACFAIGALKGAAIGAAVGTLSGGAIGGGIGYVTGGWDGAKRGALDGAADGFMTGAITGAIGGGLTSKACFVAGTQIATSEGEKPIEEIKAGDLVYAYNEQTGEVGLKPVVQTFVTESSELIHVKVDGETIDTTPEHPFYVPQKGWTAAGQLRAGDKLLLKNGKIVIVEMVQHEMLEKPVKVYNFEVADWHTYFVCNSSVLVHNTCTGSYEITYKSGNTYVGKGGEKRMLQSAERYVKKYGDEVISMKWNPAASEREAFINEYMAMKKYASPGTAGTYNKIWSPGRRFYLKELELLF